MKSGGKRKCIIEWNSKARENNFCCACPCADSINLLSIIFRPIFISQPGGHSMRTNYNLFSFLLGRFGRLIITTKDGDRNLIRREVFQELRTLDDMIQNATVTYEDDLFTYRDVCAKWENECFQNDILNLDYLMDDVSSATVPSTILVAKFS